MITTKEVLSLIKRKEIDIYLNTINLSLDSIIKVFQEYGDYDLYYAGYVESTVDALRHNLEFLRTTLAGNIKGNKR